MGYGQLSGLGTGGPGWVPLLSFLNTELEQSPTVFLENVAICTESWVLVFFPQALIRPRSVWEEPRA